jgi:hypothetical protein
MMRTIGVLGLCLLVTFAAHAQQKKNATVVGEVVDIVSYITSGTKPTSPEGKEILDASARGGNPLGILEAGTGKLYVVTMKQPNTSATSALLPFVGIKVAASGDVYQKGECSVLVMTVVGKSIK